MSGMEKMSLNCIVRHSEEELGGANKNHQMTWSNVNKIFIIYKYPHKYVKMCSKIVQLTA